MPARNIIKTYIHDGIYHVYNRGIEKRDIFLDNRDYKTFLRILKEALLPPPDSTKLKQLFTLKGVTFKGIPKQPKNFNKTIELLSYCLMPNHFHLLVKQRDDCNLSQFMQSITTRFSMYFNKRRNREGSLFQGTYKAVLIMEEPYLLHLSRYIHRNPAEQVTDLALAYSSYAEYLKIRKTPWVKPELILSFFQPSKLLFLKHTNSYKDFVEAEDVNSQEYLEKLTLEQSP